MSLTHQLALGYLHNVKYIYYVLDIRNYSRIKKLTVYLNFKYVSTDQARSIS